MKIGVVKETHPGEKRVAATPDAAGQLIQLGYEVVVQSGAGDGANYDDAAYFEAGAAVLAEAAEVWGQAEVMLKVRAPRAQAGGAHEIDLMRQGGYLISFIWPAQNAALLQQLAAKKITTLAMDAIPRISRAQKLDALSSMANVAGYRAVVEAAHHFGRFFPGQITAAGKIHPAKVLVIGAGVAGLAAVGAAKSLGAVVRAFDTRPEVKEQIMSMNAEFLEVDMAEDGSGGGGYAKVMSAEFIKAEMALFARQAQEVDIIITTALIPGKPAPKLISADMVKAMRPGGVIVDLAAEQGGNCALTAPDEVTVRHSVTIIGYTDLPSRMAAQSSRLYATNIMRLLADLTPGKDGRVVVDMGDEVARAATVVKDGEITWPPPARPVPPAAAKSKPAAAETKAAAAPARPTTTAAKPPAKSRAKPFALTLAAALGLFGLGLVAPPEFMRHFTVFTLSCFIGYMVIWNVTPSLHTPLMSVTNAISSIIIIGALTQISSDNAALMALSAFAVLITTMNIVGGFAVTRRMLAMFKR